MPETDDDTERIIQAIEARLAHVAKIDEWLVQAVTLTSHNPTSMTNHDEFIRAYIDRQNEKLQAFCNMPVEPMPADEQETFTTQFRAVLMAREAESLA